jgi:hypothetical protein
MVKGHGLSRLPSRRDCPLTRNRPSGTINANYLKEFMNVSSEDAIGTSGRCSDLHSPDSSMVMNVQDGLHLQEVEDLLISKQVDYVCTIPVGYMDWNFASHPRTMGMV